MKEKEGGVISYDLDMLIVIPTNHVSKSNAYYAAKLFFKGENVKITMRSNLDDSITILAKHTKAVLGTIKPKLTTWTQLKFNKL
jgi:hypothetical protein